MGSSPLWREREEEEGEMSLIPFFCLVHHSLKQNWMGPEAGKAIAAALADPNCTVQDIKPALIACFEL